MNRLSWLLSQEKEYGKGKGKTTLVKKVAWDWAKKIFGTFYIVFFVFQTR